MTLTCTSPKTQKDIVLPADIILPEPTLPTGISNIFIAGIGGTGVSTLSGILVMAAHLDGIAGQAVNQTGLSQKNGGVTSQVRLSRDQSLNQRMVRLPTQAASLLIGCDGVVAAHDLALATLHKTTTTAILNKRLDPVGVAGVGIGSVVSNDLVLARLATVMDVRNIHQVDASDLANRLFDATTSSAIILLGWALQKGHLPLRFAAIEAAIKLNAVDVAQNIAALQWGRLLAVDAAQVIALTQPEQTATPHMADEMQSASSLISFFSTQLAAYQNDSYADEFTAIMTLFMNWLEKTGLDADHFGCKAARALYRAMAIKDEYEVARLLTSSKARQNITDLAGANAKITYHLAPPFLNWIRDSDGHPRKLRFGRWLTPVLRGLGKMRRLRGRWYDPFSYGRAKQQEQRHKSAVIAWLHQLVDVPQTCPPSQLDKVLDLMLSIRGYGHVKEQNYKTACPQIKACLEAIHMPPNTVDTAAE